MPGILTSLGYKQRNLEYLVLWPHRSGLETILFYAFMQDMSAFDGFESLIILVAISMTASLFEDRKYIARIWTWRGGLENWPTA